MRFGGQRESSNFRDDTGRSVGGFGGGGGNALGCLIPLVMSRFGIGGVVILLIGYFILSSLGGLGSLTGGGGQVSQQSQQAAQSGPSRLDPQMEHFLRQVLGSTEDVWTSLLAKRGVRYTPTELVAYSEADQSGCGIAQSAMGPFYCPTDSNIYLDTQFFNELATRFESPGDFAMAYVIAHEVGHHVQDILGTLGKAENAQSAVGRVQGNQIQVGIELQADCYAGVWAANARAPDGQPVMQQGDFEEGMRAAEAIGDDTLQKQSQGYVVPDSFTHGTSAERMAALRKGFTTGDPAACVI